LDALLEDLTAKLTSFVHFDRLLLVLHDPERNVFRVAAFHSTQPHGIEVGFELPFEETPAGEVFRTQCRHLLPDGGAASRYPRLMALLQEEGLRAMCHLPLSTPSGRLGALVFGTRGEPYAEADLALMELATQPVAIAVENILNRQALEQERARLKLQLDVNNALVSRHDLANLFDHVSETICDVVPHEFLALTVWHADEQKLRFKIVANRKQTLVPVLDQEAPLDGTAIGEAFRRGQPRIYNYTDIVRVESEYGRNLREQGIRAMCAVPLRTSRGPIGAISVGSRQDDAYPPAMVARFQAIAEQLAIAVENALSFAKVEELNRRLKQTNLYLEEELLTTSSDEMLGKSVGIRRVIQQIETVAYTDANVLIYGETGSGKELVARALHQRSPRLKASFVKLNCAAIPTGLLESELFGHEKGAFTGAIAQKVGRFEIAHQGTLFLDEIGEIPLELQPKLLRVLQDKEFERLGGVRTLRADARLVAATNRDLKKMSEANQFRSDLYYRLNVFPIVVPPLRERREDIPMLVMHFAQHFARRFGKRVLAVPSDAMDRLTRYHWPGNIRELQNLVERSVILTTGDTLRIPLHELDDSQPLNQVAAAAGPVLSGTMDNIEREAILHALRECKGVIGGPKGAALKLGMKRTSLLYRMEKLGIQNPAS
jgi:formate hydrogenlyase transcriptional activator